MEAEADQMEAGLARAPHCDGSQGESATRTEVGRG
jgi:hypothetical protein